MLTCNSFFLLASAWLFVWLRYSNIRQLTWQKNYNTKPRDLTGAQHNLVNRIFDAMQKLKGKSGRRKYMGSEDLLRQMLSFIGRGSVNGQEVRDGILHIMHKHHIGESNTHFYEQWHQKLHNNTTPDDIVICEAVLHYLRSNDMKKYWETLNKGGVTKERLESFERKIVVEPFYAPQLIHDLEWYLKILKKVHSSIDLNLTIETANGKLSGDMRGQLKGIQDNLGIPKSDVGKVLGQMERVTQFRVHLNKTIAGLNDMDAYRELMFLDISLDYYVRQLVENVIHLKLDPPSLFKEIELLLSNLTLAYEWVELDICKKEFSSVKDELLRSDKDYNAALRVKSVVDRVKRFLGEVIDRCFNLVQPRAVELGTKCNCDVEFVNIFTEDVIRGSLFFALSMVIKKFEPVLRKTLGMQSWLVISPMRDTRGKIIFVKDLHSIDQETFKESTIVLTEIVSGDEEVPQGVSGLILLNDSDYPDVLAHVSVRARNGRVLFLVSLEPQGEQARRLRGMVDKYVWLTLPGNGLNVEEITAADARKPRSRCSSRLNLARKSPKLRMPEDKIDKYLIVPEEYTPLKVGGKSINLGKMKGKLESWVNLPECITLQFNVAEEIIANPVNAKIQTNLQVLPMPSIELGGEAGYYEGDEDEEVSSEVQERGDEVGASGGREGQGDEEGLGQVRHSGKGCAHQGLGRHQKSPRKQVQCESIHCYEEGWLLSKRHKDGSVDSERNSRRVRLCHPHQEPAQRQHRGNLRRSCQRPGRNLGRQLRRPSLQLHLQQRERELQGAVDLQQERDGKDEGRVHVQVGLEHGGLGGFCGCRTLRQLPLRAVGRNQHRLRRRQTGEGRKVPRIRD